VDRAALRLLEPARSLALSLTKDLRATMAGETPAIPADKVIAMLARGWPN
jgi:hypothetical protein